MIDHLHFKACWKNSVSTHNRNIKALATEVFKLKNNIAPEIMKELFAPKMSPYDLRNNNSFQKRRVNSVWHDTESVSYPGQKMWDLVPNEIKEFESPNAFKFKIKRRTPEEFSCRACKIYIGQVGSRVCNNVKKLFFSERKLYVINIIIVYKYGCWNVARITNSYDMKVYFHSIKTTLYLIKYNFIISTFFSWYQNIFLFNQNEFVFNKIYFHYINVFFMISKYIFIQSK